MLSDPGHGEMAEKGSDLDDIPKLARSENFITLQTHSPLDWPRSRAFSGADLVSPFTAVGSNFLNVKETSKVANVARGLDWPLSYQTQDILAAKSTPSLNQMSRKSGLFLQGGRNVLVKSAKSSPSIPDDLELDNHTYHKRPSAYERGTLSMYQTKTNQVMCNQSEDPALASGKSKHYTEDMYTADMKPGNDPHRLSTHCLSKYQPDYENVASVETPIQSEEISEIIDIEDISDSEVPHVPPRPSLSHSSPSKCPPAPPVRDPSSLKYVKVNQTHEKYPSWPVMLPNSVSDQPVNTRAHSWADHTNTHTEFPHKQQLAYTPGLRSLAEKISPILEHQGNDLSGKERNSSDPGFQIEFVYDKYGRVQQKKDDGTGMNIHRFEEFYQNSKPGYPPPRLDSDGHNYGDKEYNAPSPPERDQAGVDQFSLSQALNSASNSLHKELKNDEQQCSSRPQNNLSSSLYKPSNRLQFDVGTQNIKEDKSTNIPSTTNPPPKLDKHSRYHGRSLQDLSPSQPVPSCRTPQAGSVLSGQGVNLSVAHSVLSKPTARAFIVKQTPYYNTSTQTEAQSDNIRLTESNAEVCNVEVQVGEIDGQISPLKVLEEKSTQARMSHEFQPADRDFNENTCKSNCFQYPVLQNPLENFQTIQVKYDTDEVENLKTNPVSLFPSFNKVTEDEVSILRKLSEEFYGNRFSFTYDKHHSSSSSQELSPKPVNTSMSTHSSTMSQAESYSSVVIHASESAAPFGPDDFGSRVSGTGSHQDLSSIQELMAKGRHSLDTVSSKQHALQDSRKSNSLSSISHQRNSSAPSIGRYFSSESLQVVKQSLELLAADAKCASHKDFSFITSSLNNSRVSSESQQSLNINGNLQVESAGNSKQALYVSSVSPKIRHASDSVFDDSIPSQLEQKPKGSQNRWTEGKETVGRKPSMKKAYGIFDETERHLQVDHKSSADIHRSDSGNATMTRSHLHSDSKFLDQIQEANEGDSNGTSNSRSIHKIENTRYQKESRQSILNPQLNQLQKIVSGHVPDECGEFTTGSPRIHHESTDLVVSSKLSRGSEQLHSYNRDGLSHQESDLKKVQQQAVLSFMQRKMDRMQTSSDLHHERQRETLASMSAESIQKSSSDFVFSNSDYMDMGCRDHSKKETEWSRLRNPGSFHSNLSDMLSSHSSLCSDSVYEDIDDCTAIATSGTSSHGKHSENNTMMFYKEEKPGTDMKSGTLALDENHNKSLSARRPPPPPPRTKSPELEVPPELPPRNIQQNSLNRNSVKKTQLPANKKCEGTLKTDFKSLFSHWENSSQEDAYAAQLRQQAQRLSGQRSTVPTSMSVIHSITRMGISTSFKREPTVAQEATSPIPISLSNISSTVFSTSPLLSKTSPILSTTPVPSNTQSVMIGMISDRSSPGVGIVSSQGDPDQESMSSLSNNVSIHSDSKPSSNTAVDSLSLKKELALKQVSRKGDNSPPVPLNVYHNLQKGANFKPGLSSVARNSKTVSKDRFSAGTNVYSALSTNKLPHSPKQGDLQVTSTMKMNEQIKGTDSLALQPLPAVQAKKNESVYKEVQPVCADNSEVNRNGSHHLIGTFKPSVSKTDINHQTELQISSHFDTGEYKLGCEPSDQESVAFKSDFNRSDKHPGNIPTFKAESQIVHGAVMTSQLDTHHLHSNDNSGNVIGSNLSNVEHGATPSNIRQKSNNMSRPYPKSSTNYHPSQCVKKQIHHLERRNSVLSSASLKSPSSLNTSCTHTGQEWVTSTYGNIDGQAKQDTIGCHAAVAIQLDSKKMLQQNPVDDTASSCSHSYSEHSKQETASSSFEYDLQHIRSPSSSELESTSKRTSPQIEVFHLATDCDHWQENALLVSPKSLDPPEECFSSGQTLGKNFILEKMKNTRMGHEHFLEDISANQLHLPIEKNQVLDLKEVQLGHKSVEKDLDSDREVQQLVAELSESEKIISNVLNADAAKNRMNYMDGLFTESINVRVDISNNLVPPKMLSGSDTALPSPRENWAVDNQSEKDSRWNSLPVDYFVSTPKAILEIQLRNNNETKGLISGIQDSATLKKQKEELIGNLDKKMDLLRQEKIKLLQEISDNDLLGKKVFQLVDEKCHSPSERDKIRTYIDDVEKIVRLLLNLSGQLARAENAVQGLDQNADPKLRKMTLDKRTRLQTKHDEAKQLKEDIDKRAENVSSILRQALTPQELADYNYFVKMKSKFTIDLQELEDKITLGMEQIAELMKSIPDQRKSCIPTSSPS